MIVPFTVIFTSLIGIAVIQANEPFTFELVPRITIENASAIAWSIVIMFLCLLFVYTAALTATRYRDVTNALERFNEFDEAFKARWGAEENGRERQA